MEQRHRIIFVLRLKMLVFRIEPLCDKTSKELRYRRICEDNIEFNIKETWCLSI
jgi:hypothetical protein